MQAQQQHFTDAHQHAASLAHWNQVYDQISAGRFHSSLQRLNTDQLDIFRETINQRVVQQGQAPAEMIHFAVPLNLPDALSLQGCQVGNNTVMALRGGEEFVFHVPPQVDSLQISIRNQDLEALAPQLWQRLHRSRQRLPVLQVSESQLMAARALLLSTFEQALDNADLMGFAGSKKLIQHQFISLLLDLLNDIAPDERPNLTHATHSDIVRRSQLIVQHSPDEPVTVLDLCQKLRISRRTLQNSFQLIAGTTPVDYLRSIRLNSVRRMLLSRPESNSVREAAGHWGFYHMGHFSRDYRRLFDELPSETRAHALAL
ncbi:helix-turn-helix domain-containing protein [uncultured Aquitalea sp.]|uniref:helix-turn-helix domain-containing protein n=1 Tax=uncultured Aquitalea sp. TaxID=540272 RepID=UPI0025D728D3|nr:helix-turn-helix domain-containing protein [uncultured Aquitalea sp.]